MFLILLCYLAILHKDGKIDLFIENVRSVNFENEYLTVYHVDELFSVLESVQSIVIDASTVPMNIFKC